MITNANSGTRIDEIADGIYRISAPVTRRLHVQQYLIADEPLLFHTGLRRMFPLVSGAIRAVMPVDGCAYLLLALRSRRVRRA